MVSRFARAYSDQNHNAGIRGIHFRQLVTSSISAHLPHRLRHDLAAVPQSPNLSQDHKVPVDTLTFERKKLQRLGPLSLH